MLDKYLLALADLVMPRYCAACGGKLLMNEEHLCLGCSVNMPLTYFWTQKHNPMADRLNERIQASLQRFTPTCASGREVYSCAAALFFYKGDWRNLTRAVKYRGNLKLGRYLGAILLRKLSSSQEFSDIDTVIPVPLHKLRYLRRGYNQAATIAEAIVAGINGTRNDGPKAVLDHRSLYRNKLTKSQATLDVPRKETNVAGAFAVRDDAFKTAPKHILLVDDVFTTGSTLCECHRALRKALVERYGNEGYKIRISVATLAFVGE